ncbi:hypothetical protein FBR43_00955 [Sphingomonas baiyangensis]|uniref:Uncharacterized protein n=1 Tax=Sphingomonas baiyangensis TaxID=2572576 RepID=A0A4U1L7L0_9SPHN|nr:hypothetical protein FBR43_00955 [Sphingomonas baiyangensis]
MKTMRYFDEQVRVRRPYLRLEWCAAARDRPLRREVQPDGRVRCWTRVILEGESEGRVLRVVLLEDGETIHNAFLDRNYRDFPS